LFVELNHLWGDVLGFQVNIPIIGHILLFIIVKVETGILTFLSGIASLCVCVCV